MKPCSVIVIGCAVLAFALADSRAIAAAARGPLPPHQTYVYKKVGPVAIKADVFRPTPARPQQPVVVFIHGGSLIDGGREAIGKTPFLSLFLAEGCSVVSIDYRLAPETKLPELVTDVEDAFRWIRQDGPELFGADPDRIGVLGTSAGGFLAEIVGYRVQPRVRALVIESGYCEIVGPWQTLPSKDESHNKFHLTREEAWSKVSGLPVTNATDRPKGYGDLFNGYVRQHAEWPQAVTGWDLAAEPEKYIPYLPLRNVTPDYPPTFLLHGREDTDVPFEEAELMAVELRRHGVDFRLIIMPGAGHGLKKGDPARVDEVHHAAVEFLRSRLFSP
jgi:acetyl esterase/lipase